MAPLIPFYFFSLSLKDLFRILEMQMSLSDVPRERIVSLSSNVDVKL